MWDGLTEVLPNRLKIELRQTQPLFCRCLTRILIAALAISLLALPAAFAKTTPAQMSHGVTVRGTVASVNETGKTFEIQSKSGKNVDLSWNEATKVTHGPLKNGELATVRYMLRDGKNEATVINIAQPEKAPAAAKH